MRKIGNGQAERRAGEAKELIEREKTLSSSQLLKRILEEAKKAASEITDPGWKAKVLTAIASVTHDTKDFEEARKAANEIISNEPYWQAKKVEVLIAIASASHDIKDLEEARKAANEIIDPYLRARTLATIAISLTKLK